MRIALIDFDKNIFNKKNISKEINKNYEKSLFFDFFSEDIEEAEYCIEIRNYDLILINFNKKHYCKYYNILSILKKYYKLDYNLIVFNKDKNLSQFKSFLEKKSEIYKNVNLTTENNIDFKYIVNIIEDYFETIPKIVDLSVNHKDKTVKIITNNNEEVILKIEKNIDFQILTYFVRHYGEVININSILSAIINEPEYMNNSPIESSISSIRKLFKQSLSINPIKAFKRIGYQFKLY
jgi:DNA-binding winged helix-turn-helix (wHTH) protein